MGGQLVYTPDGDILDKHLHVLRRAPGGFDWGPEADEARIDQPAIALIADSTTKKHIALDHYKEFAEFLREELEGDEWRLPTSTSRPIPIPETSMSLMRRRHRRPSTSRWLVSTRRASRLRERSARNTTSAFTRALTIGVRNWRSSRDSPIRDHRLG